MKSDLRVICWEEYENFERSEFDCEETGENGMQSRFLCRLQSLREKYGKRIIVNSGYRSVKHSIEAAKDKPGYHTQGIAADIALPKGADGHRLVRLAFEVGFTGIGIYETHLHLDLGPRQAVWAG